MQTVNHARVYSRIVTSSNDAHHVATILIANSRWFQVEPRPDDEFEITVKDENKRFLDDLIESL